MPQININIDIVCMKCGKPVMVDAYPTRKENGGYVLKVLPCENCASKSGVAHDTRSSGDCDKCGKFHPGQDCDGYYL